MQEVRQSVGRISRRNSLDGEVVEMPIYVYRCEKCGLQFEKFQRFSDEPVKVCPECGGTVHRVYQPVGIIFKGSGFYVTDNRSKNSAGTPPRNRGGAESKESAGSGSAGSSEDKSTDT